MLIDNKAIGTRKKMGFGCNLLIGLVVFNCVVLGGGGWILSSNQEQLDPRAEARLIDTLVVGHYLANLVFTVGMFVYQISSDDEE